MSKLSVRKKLQQLRSSTCVACILSLIAIIQFFTSYGTYKYAYVPRGQIWEQLYKNTSLKVLLNKDKPVCSYTDILESPSSVETWEVAKTYEDFSSSGIVNGSFSPEHCRALFSVAVLVPYRHRPDQLHVFLPYMHNLLRKQNLHYKIFVIEQADLGRFNRGRLLNVGAARALEEGWPCLLLHDVDLLPLTAGLHACLVQPRHMSASIDKFRFVLPYSSIVGGVLAIRADQYQAINGFSNRFEGWGGEDDDLYARITANNLAVLRFPPEMSRYTMLQHRPERKNVHRARIMVENRRAPEAAARDGLTSLSYRSMKVSSQKLYTKIAVEF